MMVELLSLIGVSSIFIFINKLKFNKYFSVANIFTLCWSLTLILNYFYAKKYALIVPGSKVFIFVIVGIISFNVTYLIFSKKRKHIAFDLTNLNFNENIFKILFWIAVILITPNIINGLRTLIASGFSMASVRNDTLTLMTSGRGVYVYLTNTIPRSIFSACIIFSIFKIFLKKYKYIWYPLISILLITIAFGGRTIILEFIIEYFISFYLFKRNNKIHVNKSLIIFLLAVILLMTISRGLTNGLTKMFAKYFYEQFSFLQYILDNPNLFAIQGGSALHYGAITLSFILSPFFLFASIFNGNINVPSYYVDIHSQIFYNIGVSTSELINNNVTSIYCFLLDFGEYFYFIGFIFMALSLCFLESLILKDKKPNLKFLFISIYIIFLKHIFYSPIYYGLYSISVGFTVFFVWIISLGSNNESKNLCVKGKQL